jgi:hypothetical protein
MTEAEKNYAAGASNRAEVFKEINANPIRVDRSCFRKTDAEKANLATHQSNFKRNGLFEWNERNRQGNNRKSQIRKAA